MGASPVGWTFSAIAIEIMLLTRSLVFSETKAIGLSVHVIIVDDSAGGVRTSLIDSAGCILRKGRLHRKQC